jgi:hypothetical protein
MIVRRFVNWLRLTVTASLGGFRARAVEQTVREPMLVGASSPFVAPGQSPTSLSLSSWLDNGRRLRPHLRLTAREPGATITRPLRYNYKAQTAQSPSPEMPAPRINWAPIAAEQTDTPPVTPVTPVAPAMPIMPVGNASDELGDDLTNLEQLDADTRRLMVLRHLVRRRIFNEGFANNDIPAQYHRSLGLGEHSPQE